MALVACKECGGQVSSAAPSCPKCGISSPGAAVGKLIIMRSSSVTGAMYAVKITVDGQLMGEVKNGCSITLELPAGQRKVEVHGFSQLNNAMVKIVDGKATRYQLYFSVWGVFGGGLNFKHS